MHNRVILDVKHLRKGTILKDISFQVTEGEMVAIMGPSGSGKSTLLYQVSGMDEESDGEVWLDNVELLHLSEDEKANIRLEKMGFVFQQMNMLGNLNILDNILLPITQLRRQQRKNTKREQAADRLYAKELMKKMSIEELEGRRITEVSGGQLQRACICRSLMNHPSILFADEPTGALNRQATEAVIENFRALNREGTTVLMVTHDSKVASSCKRILYLVDGRIEGELELDHWNGISKKEREEKVNQWLSENQW